MAKYIANPVIVDAFPITAVVITEGPADLCGTKEERFSIEANGEMINLNKGLTARYEPKVGDYYVIQEDGYVYLNPKDVFERKYRVLEN